MSIGKRFFILLFSSFVGIISNPELPFASDSVALTDISGAVETVVEVSEPVKTVSETKTEPIITTAPVTTTPVVKTAPAHVETPQINRINIAGRSIEFINVDSTELDAKDHVNRYKSKFLYGHNSSNVFRALYDMNEGDTFSLTENGVTKNYVVKARVIYEKIDGYTLKLNAQTIKMSVVAKARYSGVNYDLSLMTCYGTSYGNGDASHRLVLFASAI